MRFLRIVLCVSGGWLETARAISAWGRLEVSLSVGGRKRVHAVTRHGRPAKQHAKPGLELFEHRLPCHVATLEDKVVASLDMIVAADPDVIYGLFRPIFLNSELCAALDLGSLGRCWKNVGTTANFVSAE